MSLADHETGSASERQLFAGSRGCARENVKDYVGRHRT